MRLLNVAIVTAVASGLLVSFEEPDFPPPPQEYFVRYTLEEINAEIAWRESWNELAKAIPIYCSDHFFNQQAKRVQREKAVREFCR